MDITPEFLQKLIHLHWRRLMVAGAIGLLCGYLIVLMIKPEYTASMIVGPISLRGATAVGTPLPNQTTAGFQQVGSGGELSDYTRYLQLITTPSIMPALQEKVPNLLQTLFPHEWDEAKQQWHPPRGLRASVQAMIDWMLRRPAWHAPDADRLSSYLSRQVKISLVTLPGTPTPMRKITFRHADRGLAIGILYGLHQATESVIRDEADRRSHAVIEYIQQEMGRVGLQEHRTALAELLAEQERVRMMINLNLPYAADIVISPTAPLMPDWPQPWPIIIGGMLLGIFVRLAWLIRQYPLLPKLYHDHDV